MVQRTISIALTVAAGLALATPASAELVFFSGGRSLSVAGHRMDGDSIVLVLRGGGEIACDRRFVTEIAPDEVPYPDPDPVPASLAQAPPTDAERPYAGIIDRAAARHGVDARIVRAVIEVESGYQLRARSPKGAMGLMQLMPQTARQYALKNPFDPGANIEAGTTHLRFLLDRFELRLALAAYNAGEGAVRRFGGVPPYPETRAYVSRILTLLGPHF